MAITSATFAASAGTSAFSDAFIFSITSRSRVVLTVYPPRRIWVIGNPASAR